MGICLCAARRSHTRPRDDTAASAGSLCLICSRVSLVRRRRSCRRAGLAGLKRATVPADAERARRCKRCSRRRGQSETVFLRIRASSAMALQASSRRVH